jgi:hypothetical protein
LSAYDNFDDRYLGPKSSDPTLDNDGNALLTGALYFNTSSNVMKVYTGSSWVAAYVSAAGVLLAANNLSDVASTATSRTNLNVPTRTGGDASGTWGIDITGNAATATTATSATSATSATTATNVSGGTASVTSITDSGNLTFTGTGNRITGDFSTTTFANRVMFQTSTANSNTSVSAIPNGTGIAASFNVHNISDPTNSSLAQMTALNTDIRFTSNAVGTGTYLPMTFYTGGSERMRVDTSGNVGIGTSSPSTFSPNTTYANTVAVTKTDQALSFGSYYQAGVDAYSFIKSSQVGSPSTAIDLRFFGGTTERMRIDSSGNLLMATTGEVQFYTSSYGIRASTGLEIKTGDFTRFLQGTTERMRIDSSGNVGIGTASPLTKFTVSGGYITQTDGTIRTYLGADGSGGSLLGTQTNHYLRFTTNDTERARIDSSGNLLVGYSSRFNAEKLGVQFDGNTHVGLGISDIQASGDFARFFRSSSTQVGSISHNSTSTSYNTSSDYRLKENIQPLQNALGVVAQLNPVTYTWKEDGSDGQGFIAHELQEVVPDCVTGEKDAVDAQGNPQYQGIDTSFLVATLTAAIQELKAINDAQAETITALTARVTALETN